MINSERISAFVLILVKQGKNKDIIGSLIFAPSTLLTCHVEHQIFNFELRENQREIGVENVVNTKYLVVMNVKIKSRSLSKIWTYILSILHLYSSECPELRWPTSTTRKSSWFFTFNDEPKIEKTIPSPIDQCNLKRLFAVLLHRHDMSDRNLGFRWHQQRVFLRETSFLKKYPNFFPF